MKFTIKRSEWLRGEGPEKSFLLREDDGKKCCLGFFGLVCGYNSKDLTAQSEPFDLLSVEVLAKKDPLWPEWMFGKNDPFIVFRLMEINDNPSLPAESRELQLTEIFAQQGVTVEFVD